VTFFRLFSFYRRGGLPVRHAIAKALRNMRANY